MSILKDHSPCKDPRVRPGDVVAVWFSCGAASAVAAKYTLEAYKDCTVRVINNPVLEEDEDNRRFLDDVERWLGVEIEYAFHKDYPSCSADEVWRRRKYMAGIRGAPCTHLLKREARAQWEQRNREARWTVLGFTADEVSRADRFRLTERDTLVTPLIDAGLTKGDCFNVLKAVGIDLPRVYAMGYPNANCIGCVKAGSPTYWNHVRRQHPDVFQARAALSRELGARLVTVKGERIFLDELDPSTRGRSLKSMETHECGIFCEETPATVESEDCDV
jgi:hypothetical protein